jgi:Mg-chelatase subunit ChlD
MVRFTAIWTLALLLVPLGYLYWRRKELLTRPLPDLLATLLRVGAISLILIALAGPKLLSSVEAHYVYFLVDLSDSVRENEAELIRRLNSWAVPRANTQYGLIVFGEEPYVEVPFAPTLELEEFHTEVDGTGTDLAAAISLALATFPEGGTKTLLLLSDGRPTQGDLAGVLVRAAREGVRIFTLPLEGPSGEWAVRELRAPREVAAALPFTFQSVIYATRSTQARLLIYRDGEPILNEEISLRAGLNFVEGRDELPASGVYEYRVELIAPGDALAQNNTYRALVEAIGDPHILLVEPQVAGPSPLEELLAGAGYAYERTTLREFAPTPASLLAYRAVILNDVPLRGLTDRQLKVLEHYVRDLGGGLWLIQGRRAVEEFYDRGFERMLPITYEGPEELQRPALALVLLDKSGSMGEVAGRYSKMDLLKQAAMEAVERLDERNILGIIAFDSEYEWLVPLGPIRGRKEEILRAIATLAPSGGTDVYYALQDAIGELERVRARVKHILVFSDGKVVREGRNFTRLFREISEGAISASSIAIGPKADLDFLWRLAEEGSGMKYPVKDAEDLPEITLEELIRLERARWIKGPVAVEPGPFTSDLGPLALSGIPPVGGYVLTFEKPTAQTSLVVRAADLEKDPLVSRWRYGLGVVLVLNSGFTEGLKLWLDWQELGQLSAELLGLVYSEAPLQPEGLTVHTQLEGERLTVTVEAQQQGRWLDLLPLEGQLSRPDGEARTLEFEQVAPGRYQATVEDLAEGVYLLSVSEESLGQVKEALAIPYAEEYRRIGVDQELLTRIARETEGEYLESLGDLAPLLEGRAWTYREVWQPVVLLALLVFLADLAARKLPLPGS